MATKIQVKDLGVAFKGTSILKSVSLELRDHEILGIIGPANSGKSTFLRCLNRLNDLIPGMTHTGAVRLDGEEIYDDDVNVAEIRRRVGMVYAVPVALPKSIYENIVFGPRLKGISNRATLDEIVERTLKAAVLWDEVKDRLASSALRLSGGQQQRLCIARALALEPEVLMLDEPCSGLDPISTARIEEALTDLKERYAVILVTNNVMQSARVADRTAFFLMGELVECDVTDKIFTKPNDPRTNDYVTGRFG
jgi:phosphate transport system ATP-binding protein